MMIGWLLVDLMIVVLEMKVEGFDFAPILDVIFGGLSSTELYEYTSSIEIISYLFSKSKLLPKSLIDDMVESLLNTVLEIPITAECTSEIFNLFSKLCVSNTNNFFTIIVKPETFVFLYNACKKVLDTYVEDSSDRPSTYISPSVAVQKFLATVAQIIYQEPTISSGLTKCGKMEIPDETNAKFFAYGDSIVSILPLEVKPDSKTTETRVFIRNMYGMYELISTTVQTVNDLNNEYFRDTYVPIQPITWPENKAKTSIPDEKIYDQKGEFDEFLDVIEYYNHKPHKGIQRLIEKACELFGVTISVSHKELTPYIIHTHSGLEYLIVNYCQCYNRVVPKSTLKIGDKVNLWRIENGSLRPINNEVDLGNPYKIIGINGNVYLVKSEIDGNEKWVSKYMFC